MRVLFIPDERTAALFESLVKPGVEVCHLDSQIDATDIEHVYCVLAQGDATMPVIEAIAQRFDGKLKVGAEMSVIVI